MLCCFYFIFFTSYPSSFFFFLLANTTDDFTLIMVAGDSNVQAAGRNIVVMTVYRVLLVVGGTPYWFLGHTVCYLAVGTLFADVLATRFIVDHNHKGHHKVQAEHLLEVVEQAFKHEAGAGGAAATADTESTADTTDTTNTTNTTNTADKSGKTSMLVTFLTLTVLYMGEIVGVSMSNVPYFFIFQQYQIGVCILLFVFMVCAVRCALRKYKVLLAIFLKKVLALNPKEILRQKNIAARAQDAGDENTRRVNSEVGLTEEKTEGKEEGGTALDEVSLEEGTTGTTTGTTTGPTSTNCCTGCLHTLQAQTAGGMTSRQACRFWCFQEPGTVRFAWMCLAGFGCCVALGVYVHAVTMWTTPLVLSVGGPLYLFLFTVAYTRWHKVRDFTMDWITVLFGTAALFVLFMMTLLSYLTEIPLTCQLATGPTTNGTNGINGTNGTNGTNGYDPDCLGITWVGFAIGGGIWVLTTTYLSFVNWFNTFEYTRTLCTTSLMSCGTLLLWAGLFWSVTLHGSVDMNALVVLFIVLVYPTVVALGLALCILKDNRFHMTPSVFKLLLVSLSIILLFFGAVCWVNLTIGLGLIAVYLLVSRVDHTLHREHREHRF